MCAYSMIADDWTRRIGDKFAPLTQPNFTQWITNGITREEFDALKEEVKSLKKFLKAAKIYDEETGAGGCETESKIALLKQIAEALGVDLSDALPAHLS